MNGSGRFKVVYQPISGFTENTRRITGTERAWHKCRPLFNASTWIATPREWNADWREVAALIARNTSEASRIVLSGYSWGAGWGVLKLAKHLNTMDRGIYSAVLVDPVYRLRGTPTKPQVLAGITNPWSLLGKTEMARDWLPIKIPKYFRQVSYFRQAIDRPCGRRLVAEDPKTTLVKPAKWLQVGHARVDEQQRVLDEIYNEVGNAVSGFL